MNKIPKKLHLYWDKSPMSRLQVKTLDTFMKLNTDWQVYVYVPKERYIGNDSYVPDYTGEDYFWMVSHNPYIKLITVDLEDYGIKDDLHDILRSDILRYHLLYNEGGVWSDFDVVWLKPMSYLSEIAGRDDFGGTICTFMGAFYNISILVSAPQHPFYKLLIDECNTIQDTFEGKPDHQEYGTAMWNRMFPDLTGESLLKDYPDLVNLEYATFFPYSIYNMPALYNRIDFSVLNDKVMCVHWFNGHELSKQYVNNNGLDRKCSMTGIVKHTEGPV